jgi:hypothetical protein
VKQCIVNKISEDSGWRRKQGRSAKARTVDHHEEIPSINGKSDTAVSGAEQPKNESRDLQGPGVVGRQPGTANTTVFKKFATNGR